MAWEPQCSSCFGGGVSRRSTDSRSSALGQESIVRTGRVPEEWSSPSLVRTTIVCAGVIELSRYSADSGRSWSESHAVYWSSRSIAWAPYTRDSLDPSGDDERLTQLPLRLPSVRGSGAEAEWLEHCAWMSRQHFRVSIRAVSPDSYENTESTRT